MKKTICFMVASVLIWVGGYGAYVYMYQHADFKIRTIQGDDAILEEIGIQLQYRSNDSYVSTLIQKNDTRYQIDNQTKSSEGNRVYEHYDYDTKDAREWIIEEQQLEGCETHHRRLDHVQINYEILFTEDRSEVLLHTGLSDFSKEEYTYIETATVCEGDVQVSNEIKRVDALENDYDLALDQLLAQYDSKHYYFVPYAPTRTKGTRYLYQLTKDEETWKVEELNELSETQEMIGCFVIERRILVLSKDEKHLYVTCYDTTGDELSTTTIDTILPKGMRFYQQGAYLMWKTDSTLYVFDGDEMKLMTQIPLDASLLEKELGYTFIPYMKNETLWIGSLEYTNDGREYARVQAWKQETKRYEGTIDFLKSGPSATDMRRPYLIEIGFQ